MGGPDGKGEGQMVAENEAEGEIHRAMKKTLGWLFDIGDEILPSYMGIFKQNHYKDPTINKQYLNGKQEGFFRGSIGWVDGLHQKLMFGPNPNGPRTK